LVCDQGSLVGLCMQDYKSLCASVTTCVTLVSIQTDRQTDTHADTQRAFWPVFVWTAQPDELIEPTNGSKPISINFQHNPIMIQYKHDCPGKGRCSRVICIIPESVTDMQTYGSRCNPRSVATSRVSCVCD